MRRGIVETIRLSARLPVNAQFPGLRSVLFDALQDSLGRERVASITKNPRLTLGAVIIKEPINIGTAPNLDMINHLVTKRTFYFATKLTLYTNGHLVLLNDLRKSF
jgi:hypothetical protein